MVGLKGMQIEVASFCHSFGDVTAIRRLEPKRDYRSLASCVSSGNVGREGCFDPR